MKKLVCWLILINCAALWAAVGIIFHLLNQMKVL